MADATAGQGARSRRGARYVQVEIDTRDGPGELDRLKKPLCGVIHYDVDEATDGNCTASDAPLAQWDRYKGGGNCSLLHNARVGTCND